MDRTQHARREKMVADPPLFRLDAALFAPSSAGAAHALFAPEHYESRYAYPLLVWLHAPGRNDERQLLRIMPLVSMRNYVAVAPRGFAVTDSSPLLYDWPQQPDCIEQAEARVFEAIEAAQEKLHIAPRRVFLAGFDTGGTMALRIAMKYPERFAGVVSICGALPKGYCPLTQVNRMRALPVMLAVAAGSDRYSPETACGDLRLLHAAGIQLVSLRQYSCGHELNRHMLGDIDRWIMERIAESRALQESSPPRRRRASERGSRRDNVRRTDW
jgi:phospholipase/carboxylesterase